MTLPPAALVSLPRRLADARGEPDQHPARAKLVAERAGLWLALEQRYVHRYSMPCTIQPTLERQAKGQIRTLVLLTTTPSCDQPGEAVSDPTVTKRSISTLGGVIMMRRILILIAVLAVPLSLIAGPTVQAAVAQGTSTAVVTPASGPAGSTVTGSGSNWTAGDHIQAYWSDDNSTLGGEVVVGPDGTFTDPGLKIPTGVASGPHQILFFGRRRPLFRGHRLRRHRHLAHATTVVVLGSVSVPHALRRAGRIAVRDEGRRLDIWRRGPHNAA